MNKDIIKAFKIAKIAHSGQKYGDKPYSFHYVSVYKIAKKMNFSDDILISCILHDTIEDTHIDYNYILKEFGNNIADLVYCVTNELGATRKTKFLYTYPKMLRNRKSIGIKLCDRLANASMPEKREMYKKEYPIFKKVLYIKNEYDKLWNELDKLLLN